MRRLWLNILLFSLVVWGGVSSLAVAASDSVTPDDPLWMRQWYLRQVRAPEAWAVTTGEPSVIVAIIDGAIDITHPDLKEVIWLNPREIARDGIDNDQNGYVDDLVGWNFVTSRPNVMPGRTDVKHEEAWSHGTIVASILAAKGNNGTGMAGTAWNVRLMPLVVLDQEGEGSLQNVIRAIRYAVTHGASVINMSFVGYEASPQLQAEITRAAQAGVVIVAATGNGDVRQGFNIDDAPAHPVCDDGGKNEVIGVSGTDTLDQRALYANYGRACTDIAAPAYDMVAARPSFTHDQENTTGIVGYAERLGGTSLATPLVSGAAALIKSVRPDLTAEQIRNRLLLTADAISDPAAPEAQGKLGLGRLDIGRALEGIETWSPDGRPVPIRPSAASATTRLPTPLGRALQWMARRPAVASLFPL